MAVFELSYCEEDGDAIVAEIQCFGPFSDVPGVLNRLRHHSKVEIITNSDNDLFAGNVDRIGVPFLRVITSEDTNRRERYSTTCWNSWVADANRFFTWPKDSTTISCRRTQLVGSVSGSIAEDNEAIQHTYHIPSCPTSLACQHWSDSRVYDGCMGTRNFRNSRANRLFCCGSGGKFTTFIVQFRRLTPLQFP
jgi:hypothetical protein